MSWRRRTGATRPFAPFGPFAPFRGRLAAIGIVGVIAWLVAAPGPVLGATADFGTPSIRSTFGQGIEFRQPISFSGPVRRVELLLGLPGSDASEVRVVPAGASASTLTYTLETTNGELLPNTTLTARWRIVGQDGSISLGPFATVRYEDTRFSWQTRQDGVVRVHWYEGGADFGARALEIGTRGIEAASRLLGVTETEPVDFFIYAGQAAFYEALGPGTRENVGGQANAEIRTLFALITPGEINASWVENVIPHELTHLVFDTAVRNPYHFPPRWLNEGLAVYLAQGYGVGDRTEVERAIADGSLMPLSALVHQFPTTRDRFSLAYAESVAAVDHLVRTRGEPALVALVRSYAGGVTDDEAFRSAIGIDVAAFDAEWRSSLRAREPVAHGPRPAPAGPLPAGWTGAATAGTPAHGGIPAPGEPGPAERGADPVGALAAGALAVAALVVGLLLVLRRQRPPASSRRHTDGGAPTGGASS